MPFNRFRTYEGRYVDTVLGPEMRSTGEVMGIDAGFGIAYAKSQAGAQNGLPTSGQVFVSVANRDKRHMIFPVKRLADLGFEILATSGTASVLKRNGVESTVIRKLHEEHTAEDGEARSTIVDKIRDPGHPAHHQHAARHDRRRQPARRRLRDPHGRSRRGHPVHHHGPGPGRRGAGHRGAHRAPRRGRLAAGVGRGRPQGTRRVCMSFGSRARAAMDAYGPACVGIDPHAALLDDWGLPDSVEGLEQFAAICVEAFAGHVGFVKPQSAFFERFGSRGVAVLERTIQDLRHTGTLVVLDVKRGDIGSTAAAYAEAYLDEDSPDGRRRRHGQPVPRLRLARAVLRGRRAARWRRLRAGADVEPGGPGGAAAVRDGVHRGRPHPGPAQGAQRRRRHRWVRSARWSEPRSARPRRTSRSTARCSLRASAPRAARSTTSCGCSARWPITCFRPRHGGFWPPDRTSCHSAILLPGSTPNLYARCK